MGLPGVRKARVRVGKPKPCIRRGYIDRGTKSDALLKAFMDEIPGEDFLPDGWRFFDVDHFLDDYGHLGMALWASSASCHTLILNGNRVVRIWHDCTTGCLVEAQPHVLSLFKMATIPVKARNKSFPFIYRVKIKTESDMTLLAKHVKRIYGI